MDSQDGIPSPLSRLLAPLEIGKDTFRKGFTIYAKALLTFATAVLLLFGILFALTESVIISQFQGIENETAQRELNRFDRQMRRPIERLHSVFAFWRASYPPRHEETPSGDTAAFSMSSDFLKISGVDLLYLRSEGGKTIERGLPSAENATGLQIRSLLNSLPSDFAPPGAVRSGYFLFGNQLYILAAGQLPHTSATSAPSARGTLLVVGQRVTDALLREFAPVGTEEISARSFRSALAEPNLRLDLIRLLSSGVPVVAEKNEETLLGFVLLKDWNGLASAFVEAGMPRELYLAGVRSTRIFLVAMTAAGGFLVLILWVVIDLNLLRRIGRMDRSVRDLRETGELPGDLVRAEEDELGRLAGSIRDLTISLQDAENRYRMLFETSKDGTLLLDASTFRIAEFNHSFLEMFGLQGRPVAGSSPEELLPGFPTGGVRACEAASRAFHAAEFVFHAGGGKAVFAEVIGVFFETSAARFLQLNFRDISERKENETALRELSGRLLRLQDDERRRIARELHDSTAQNLSALEMNFSMIEKLVQNSGEEARSLVRASRHIAGQCSREIRTLSYLLHPPLLDEVGLLFALRWFVEGYSSRTNIAVSLELPNEFPRLDNDLETALFRVVQESLTNIYKHSGSETAKVALFSRPEGVVLEVSDRGAGFAGGEVSDFARHGLGLAGMRERIRQQGGTFSIQTCPGGTVVRVDIPRACFLPVSQPDEGEESSTEL